MVSNHTSHKGKFLNVLVVFLTVVAAVIVASQFIQQKAADDGRFSLRSPLKKAA